MSYKAMRQDCLKLVILLLMFTMRYFLKSVYTFPVVTKAGSGRMSPVRSRTMKEYDQVGHFCSYLIDLFGDWFIQAI